MLHRCLKIRIQTSRLLADDQKNVGNSSPAKPIYAVTDHRIFADRKQMFVHKPGQRLKSGSCSARQYDSFHLLSSSLSKSFAFGSALYMKLVGSTFHLFIKSLRFRSTSSCSPVWYTCLKLALPSWCTRQSPAMSNRYPFSLAR